MTELKRLSPVQFKASVRRTEARDDWTVVREYDDEGKGPYVVDLSHKARWDLQDGDLGRFSPCEASIPGEYGDCTVAGDVLVNRMNRTQCSIWHLGETAPEMPAETGYTDVTEATLCLALIGPRVFAITEKLSALDMVGTDRKTPFLLQGPLSHVPCQVVVAAKGDRLDGAVMFTCSRGYGEAMVHAVLDAGAEFGLKPAGEDRFAAFWSEISG